MKKWIYKWLPIIFGCHCRGERSFYYKNVQFPICARCTGELVGIAFAPFFCAFFGASLWLSILLCLPMVIDGILQLKTEYTSNNFKRFVTGLLCGYGFTSFSIRLGVLAYNIGIYIGKNL